MTIDVTKIFDLSGKRIAITGGGGELCGTIAEGLGRLGVKIALLDIDLPAAERRMKVITSGGGTALALRCDVLDEAEVARCYQEICREWGGVDLLLNGAGGNNPQGSAEVDFLEPEGEEADGVHPGRPGSGGSSSGSTHPGGAKSFFDIPLEGFRRTFDLNFLGTVVPSRVLTTGMVERRSGSIVNISSMSAFTPLTKVGAYSAAKAAVANFTKWLAVHFSHVGVRVNALAPGFFMTEQLRFLHIDPATGEYTERAKKVVAATPMGRYGEPEELIGTVIWLLSEGSRFVTGNVVPIDGGFSSYAI